MKHAIVIIKLGLSGVLGWLIVLSGQMGYASLDYYYANNHLQQWIEDGNVSSEPSYLEALSAIKLSNELHPDNPQFLETLGAIQEQGVYDGHVDKSNSLLALANYNKSIQLRPLSPLSWILKVMAKWQLGEIDDDMWNAIVMLGKTGPYSIEANLVIVDVSLMLILEDTEYAVRAKQLMAVHYQRGMGNPRAVDRLKNIVAEHGAEEIIANL